MWLVHSTLVTAALFLLADLIATQRGKAGDRLVGGRAVKQPFLLGACFIIAGLTVIGMPPLSGFVGKILILKTTLNSEQALVFWPVYLIMSLALIVAISRAGTSLFWEHKDKGGEAADVANAHPLQVIVLVGLLTSSILLVVFGDLATQYALETATQLHDISGGINAVLKGGL